MMSSFILSWHRSKLDSDLLAIFEPNHIVDLVCTVRELINFISKHTYIIHKQWPQTHLLFNIIIIWNIFGANECHIDHFNQMFYVRTLGNASNCEWICCTYNDPMHILFIYHIRSCPLFQRNLNLFEWISHCGTTLYTMVLRYWNFVIEIGHAERCVYHNIHIMFLSHHQSCKFTIIIIHKLLISKFILDDSCMHYNNNQR